MGFSLYHFLFVALNFIVFSHAFVVSAFQELSNGAPFLLVFLVINEQFLLFLLRPLFIGQLWRENITPTFTQLHPISTFKIGGIFGPFPLSKEIDDDDQLQVLQQTPAIFFYVGIIVFKLLLEIVWTSTLEEPDKLDPLVVSVLLDQYLQVQIFLGSELTFILFIEGCDVLVKHFNARKIGIKQLSIFCDLFNHFGHVEPIDFFGTQS